MAQTPAPTNSAAPAAKINPALLNPAALNAKAPDVFDVKFTTSAGDIVIEVHRAWAPIGADRFYNMAKNNFFDDASFFRVVPGFMAQLASRPTQSLSGLDESRHQRRSREAVQRPGFVSFANTGTPNSRGTQVFISTGNNSFLDSKMFAPFGKVTEGMEVVRNFTAGMAKPPPKSRGRFTRRARPIWTRTTPKLDYIKSTTVTETAAETPAAPAKK